MSIKGLFETNDTYNNNGEEFDNEDFDKENFNIQNLEILEKEPEFSMKDSIEKLKK